MPRAGRQSAALFNLRKCRNVSVLTASGAAKHGLDTEFEGLGQGVTPQLLAMYKGALEIVR